jgi:hypothetical protein
MSEPDNHQIRPPGPVADYTSHRANVNGKLPIHIQRPALPVKLSPNCLD